MLLIANEAPLGPEWLDHSLKGQWDGHRECHIGGDFLLAYKLADGGAPGLVVFVRTSSHTDLFGEWTRSLVALIDSKSGDLLAVTCQRRPPARRPLLAIGGMTRCICLRVHRGGKSSAGGNP